MTQPFHDLAARTKRRRNRPIRGWWYRHGLWGYNIRHWMLHPWQLWGVGRAEITHRRQRMKRGWSDRDAWSLDHHLAHVISGAIRYMADIAHGWPGEPMTYEEWVQILRDIADGFEAHTLGYDGPEVKAERQVKFNMAMDLFAKYYPHLFD